MRGESPGRGDPGGLGRRADSAGSGRGAGRGVAALLSVGNAGLAGPGGGLGAAAQGPPALAGRSHRAVGKGAWTNPAASVPGSRRWCVRPSAAWGSSRRPATEGKPLGKDKAGRRKRRPTVRALKAAKVLAQARLVRREENPLQSADLADRSAESAPPEMVRRPAVLPPYLKER